MNEREIRAYSILAKGDKPQALDTENYLVKSQNGGGKYRVSRHGSEWSCECPDHAHRKVLCKHILTVAFWLRVKVKRKSSFTIPELEKKVCPYCKSQGIIKYGTRKNRGEPKQRFSCGKCGKKFVSDVCPKFKGTDRTITAVMDMYYKGMSVRQIQDHLKQFHNFKVHHATIHRWVKRFSKAITDYTDEIRVKPCGVITADETMLRAGGEWSYMWNVMDKKSRFLIASHVSPSRDGVYPQLVFEEAKWRMKGLPKVIVTDGYGGYRYAKRKVFTNHKKPVEVEHKHDIHFMDRGNNNNRIERYMGSVKSRTKTMRGMQNDKTGNELMQGWVAYYNFIRPHQALNGLTPAEKVGIELGLNGGNRWLQLLKMSKEVST